ncbi:MAG: DUF177 domain-containing protein [Clostridia bacterium]|nr:DUF177 domain-containing protein [Clostridia bacterium]
MLLNLVKVKNEEGIVQQFSVEMPIDVDLIRERGYEILSPVSVKGNYYYQNEELFLTATAQVTLMCVCDSCAEHFEKVFIFPVKETFVEDYNVKNDDDYVINHMTVNIEKPVIDNFIQSLPTKIKCKDDCKGLCSVCGKNKNFFSCNCEEIENIQQQLENPFGKLKN